MNRNFILTATALLLAILVSYSNYFSSELHVSEYPTIRDNASIRTLTHIPRFFVDPSTTSTLASGSLYHPIVTTSLALDYFIGGGAPIVFHITNFLIFLASLALICWLIWFIFERTLPDSWNPYLALFATALLGLHPASAQIVNSINQRGELIAILCVVAGIAIYARFPAKRALCLYLVPPLTGLFAHPSALIFAPLLLAYMVLIEVPATDEEDITPEQMKSRDQTQAPAQAPSGVPTRIRIRRRKHPFRRYVKVQFRRFAPALAFTAVAGAVEWSYARAAVSVPGESLVRYWFTEPWVAFRYLIAFFAPVQLSAASDLAAFTSFDFRGVLGALFLIGLVIVALILASDRPMRPAVFGIWWFLIGIAPGALLLQSDVESDRRMFLPFIGLAMCVTWTARIKLLPVDTPLRDLPFNRLQAIAAGIVLLALAAGTYVRNGVWHSEETLWHDAVRKNPGNARSLLNYGLALAARGRSAEAYDYLQRAYRLRPWFAEVQAALASVSAALRHNQEAENHFLLARKMAADEPSSHMPYAEWLEKQGRLKEAIDAYVWASSLAPADMRPRYALMRLYKATHDWDNLRRTVEAASAVAPKDAATKPFIETSRLYPDAVTGAERMAHDQPDSQHFLELAEAYCMTSQYEKCLKTAQKVIQLDPKSAVGYNALGAAYVSLGRMDDGINAVKKALALDPDLKPAQANLTSFTAHAELSAP